MRGIILAGGTGSRMRPLTLVSNKHLLPVYNKPMIYYPIKTLVGAGIKDILIVTGAESAGDFLKLLGSGTEFGARFTYRLQDKAGGIADALRLGEDFVQGEKFVIILGDNIFEDSMKQYVEEFRKGSEEARIFLKEVPDPERFGVAELKGDKVASIEEKPKKPKSNYCVTGLYMYPGKVFDVIRGLKPSARGEFEITDVNNYYVKKGTMKATVLKGFWSDAGKFESLYRASTLVREKEKEED